jgi:hypothetical protein
MAAFVISQSMMKDEAIHDRVVGDERGVTLSSDVRCFYKIKEIPMADAESKIIMHSRESVAYQLMQDIIAQEGTSQKTREYLLTLYVQCLKATSGVTLAVVLKKD